MRLKAAKKWTGYAELGSGIGLIQKEFHCLIQHLASRYPLGLRGLGNGVSERVEGIRVRRRAFGRR